MPLLGPVVIDLFVIRISLLLSLRYPVHLSKFFKASRLVLFSGLEDWVGTRGPDSHPDPWIYTMEGKVPPSDIYGVGGLTGSCCSNWMSSWGPAGLKLPGQSFADDRDGNVLPAVADALNGSRRVYLQGPRVGHGTPIMDKAIPREPDGTPIYLAVWDYLLTDVSPAPGPTPRLNDSEVCCCAAYRGTFTGPRGCVKCN